MPILAKFREFLDASKASYSVHSHPTAYTAQEIAALSHVKGRALAKVVMVKAGAETSPCSSCPPTTRWTSGD